MMSWMSRVLAAFVLTAFPEVLHAQIVIEHPFEVGEPSEAVAAITASCACDWGVLGREAASLKLSIDGEYSQHLLLVRGDAPAEYRVLLGAVSAGEHTLGIEWDKARSATRTGETRIGEIEIHLFRPNDPEYSWLSRAPILHARPGTVEKFSDVPLMMYVEAAREARGYDYTVIFSHEDGGTPTDRLMATWGRTTDIELVYRFSRASEESVLEEAYQGVDHEIRPFRGPRSGDHPLLWVSTTNNMVSDSGPEHVVRFAPAPVFVTLDRVSRERVMDDNPWLYAVTSAEMSREKRIDARAKPGTGKIPDPRRFAVIEACGELENATLAFDLATGRSGEETRWYPSDRGDARFRIARSGCFRAALPLPEASTSGSITGIRARAYTRPPREDEAPLPPGSGRVTLQSVNAVFMLDEAFNPSPSALRWSGTLELTGETPAVPVPTDGR